jgi:hypothetical protein
MKNILILIAMLLSAGYAKAQKVYQTSTKSEADKKVYVTTVKSEANMLVYETTVKSEAKPYSGMWYWTKVNRRRTGKYILQR